MTKKMKRALQINMNINPPIATDTAIAIVDLMSSPAMTRVVTVDMFGVTLVGGTGVVASEGQDKQSVGLLCP
jgi:hypothetical protein